MNTKTYIALCEQLASTEPQAGLPRFYDEGKHYYAVAYPLMERHHNPRQFSVFHKTNPSWTMFCEVLGLALIFGIDIPQGS